MANQLPVESPTEPIEVLIYAPFTGNGGVRRLVLRLLETWLKISDRQQWRFRVLGQPVDGNGEPIPWPDDAFIPLCGGTIGEHLGSGLIDFLVSNQDKFFADLRHHAKTADIVWLTQPWWTLRIQNEVVDLPAHLVPTVHDYAFDELDWQGPFGDGFRQEAQALVQATSHSILSSEYMRQAAITRYGLQPNDGTVIYLADFVPVGFAASPEAAARARAKYNLPDQYWLAFHAVGHKDPLTIFEALAKFRKQHPTARVPLVLAGVNTERMAPDAKNSDGYSEKVKSTVRSLGLEYGRDYFITGFVDDDDIAGIYSGALACVAASRSEAGLSGTIFEAFRAETPLIFSNIRPFVERLGTDKRYGLHFQVGDSDSLSQRMGELWSDPAGRAARAEAAYNFTCQRTWEDVGRDYLNVFAQQAARGPATRRWQPPYTSTVPPPKMRRKVLSKLVRGLKRLIKSKA